MADKSVEPRPWSLTKAVERSGEEADGIRLTRVDEASGLLTVDVLLKVAVQECVGDV